MTLDDSCIVHDRASFAISLSGGQVVKLSVELII